MNGNVNIHYRGCLMADKKKKSGRKRKTIPDKKISNESESERERETIERVLSIGASAKVKLYHQFLQRISQGVTLRPSEHKYFRQLESELEEKSGIQPSEKGNIIISMDDAAAYCGTSKKTISVNIKRGRIKQNSDGTFSKTELDKYLAGFGRESKSAKSETIKGQQEKAELRFRLARAKREEMIVNQMKGNLASWKEIHEEWAARVRAVAAGLNTMPDRLPPLIVGKSRDEIRAILQREFDELRETYERSGKVTPK